MTARSFIVALSLGALLFLLGCPTVKLGGVALKAGSVSPTGFTLVTQIVVEETDEVETPTEGKGMLAVLVPEGWRVVDARMTSPLEGSVRRLTPVPQAALAHGETFPNEPGMWWGFGSNTQAIPQGRYDYTVEIDVEVPKKTKSGLIGISAGVWNDSMDELTAPAKYEIKLKGRKGELKSLGNAPAAAEPAYAPPAEEEDPEGKGGNDKASAG